MSNYNKKELIRSFFDTLDEDQQKVWLKVRRACDSSLYYFVKDIGGAARKAGGDISSQVHQPILSWWQNHKNDRAATFWPRGWRKTTCLTEWGNIREYLLNNEVRILIPSEKIETASTWIRWMEAQILTNRRLRWIYPELSIVDRAYTTASTWSGERCLLPRQGVYPEATFTCVGVRGASQGGHFDIVSGDDIVGEKGMESPTVLEDAMRWFDNVEELLVEPDRSRPNPSIVRLVGCLTGDTWVLMADNTSKPISEIKAGDSIWTRADDGAATIQSVIAMIPQGLCETWEVKTLHQSIRGTGNHPVLQEDGTWKHLSKLSPGDRIVGTNIIWGGEIIGETMAWFLGLFTGDGSCIPHNGSYAICIADGVHEDIRSKTISSYKEITGRLPKLSSHKQWMLWSKDFGTFLNQIGLCEKATSKRIPKLIYSLVPKERLAYIRGLLDADGWSNPKHKNLCSIEVANEQLIRDLKRLCQISGISVGAVRHRTRTILPPHSPVPVTNTFWSISLNLNLGQSVKKINSNFLSERVASVSQNQPEEVYDLVVCGNHNFIANGLVVHNTHWGNGDFGHYVQENYPEYEWRIVPALKDPDLLDRGSIHYVQREDAEAGESNWPEVWTTQHYIDMKANPEKEMVFWAQHMNNPNKSSAMTKFERAWLRYFHWEDSDKGKVIVTEKEDGSDGEKFLLRDIPLFGQIDPGGFAETKMLKKGSRNVILIGGQPRTSIKKFVVFVSARKMKHPSDFLNELFDKNEEFRPGSWAIDTIGPGQFMYSTILEERSKRHKSMPIFPNPIVVSKGAKDDDIQSLIPPGANGEIYIHRSMKELIGEWISYPNSMTVDILDALGKLNKARWSRHIRQKEIDPLEKWGLRAKIEEPDGRSDITGY